MTVVSHPGASARPEVGVPGPPRRRLAAWLIGLGLALVAAMVLGVGVGSTIVGPGTVARVLTHHLVGWPRTPTWSLSSDSIVWNVRAPRVVLGVIVGAALAAAGAALQAMVRNLLADPYLLGVSSGASTGAALLILFGVGVSAGAYSLTVSAFLGALLAALAVFLLASMRGRVTSVRLLLSGVAIGYVMYAATSFLLMAAPSSDQGGVQGVLFFMLGSLSQARWSSIAVVAVAVALMLALLLVWGRKIDALAIGDDTARTLGIAPTRFRGELLVVVALGIGAVVAVAGGIGFIGLVVPHLARRFVGSAHRRLIPVAALMGAVFIVVADAVARVVLSPAEVPIGVITAIAGAPFLMILIRRFYAADHS